MIHRVSTVLLLVSFLVHFCAGDEVFTKYQSNVSGSIDGASKTVTCNGRKTPIVAVKYSENGCKALKTLPLDDDADEEEDNKRTTANDWMKAFNGLKLNFDKTNVYAFGDRKYIVIPNGEGKYVFISKSDKEAKLFLIKATSKMPCDIMSCICKVINNPTISSFQKAVMEIKEQVESPKMESKTRNRRSTGEVPSILGRFGGILGGGSQQQQQPQQQQPQFGPSRQYPRNPQENYYD